MEKFAKSIKFIEGLLYLLIFNFSYLIVLYIGDRYDSRNFESVIISTLFSSLICIVIMLFNNVFNTVRKSTEENIVIMFFCAILNAFAVTTIAFLFRSFAFPRTVIILGFFIQVIGFVAVKLLFMKLINSHRAIVKSMIICNNSEVKEIFIKIMNKNKGNDSIKYVCFDNYKNYTRLMNNINRIYISDTLNRDTVNDIINIAIENQIQVCIVPKTYEIVIKNSRLHFAEDLPYLKIVDMQIPFERRIIKRAIDMLFSFIGLILLSPIMLLVALIILIKEGRPIIYKQERVTLNNQSFMLYKFRTMIKNAESKSGPMWSSAEDDRVTPLGKKLRKFWLDELPQLWNVLKGDMSLVGPRPERPIFIEKFSKNIPDFTYRLSVKAGITGYAQVMGKYATTPDKKLKFDLIYIQNQSLLFDFSIILETLKKVVLGTLTRSENREKTYEEIIDYYNLDVILNNDYLEFK